MKKFVILCSAMFFAAFSFAADIYSIVGKKGSVKNYTQTDFNVTTKFGNYFRTPVAKIAHSYNSENQETEEVQYTPRDAVTQKTTFSYNSDGNLTEKICVNADNELLWKETVAYKNGKKSEASEYDSTGVLKAKTIFTYAGGLLVDESGYDGEGALVWKNVYTYTENQSMESFAKYFADGSLNEKAVYKYNSDNGLEGITYYGKDGAETALEVLRYDAAGFITEVTTYKDAKVAKRTLLRYDGEGNLNKVSEYNVSEKFGTTVNELTAISESTYAYYPVLELE